MIEKKREREKKERNRGKKREGTYELTTQEEYNNLLVIEEHRQQRCYHFGKVKHQ